MFEQIEKYEVSLQEKIQNVVKNNKIILLICMFLKYLIKTEGMMIVIYSLYWLGTPLYGIKIIVVTSIGELINGSLKWYILRSRPFWKYNNIKCLSSAWEEDFSCPSGHAQGTSQLMFSLMYIYNWNLTLSLIVSVLCFLVGLSRIALGVHYISDVVIGWILGIIISYVILKSEIIDTYFEDFNSLECVLMGNCLMMLFYIVMSTIRTYKSVNQDNIEKFKKNGYNNFIKNDKVSIEKLEISSRKFTGLYTPILGSLIGASFATIFVKEYEWDYFYTKCTFSDLKYTCLRTLFGLSIVLICLYLSLSMKKVKLLHYLIDLFIFIVCGVWFITSLKVFDLLDIPGCSEYI